LIGDRLDVTPPGGVRTGPPSVLVDPSPELEASSLDWTSGEFEPSGVVLDPSAGGAL